MIISQITHKQMHCYPTNHTESQWQIIEKKLNDNRKKTSQTLKIIPIPKQNLTVSHNTKKRRPGTSPQKTKKSREINK